MPRIGRMTRLRIASLLLALIGTAAFESSAAGEGGVSIPTCDANHYILAEPCDRAWMWSPVSPMTMARLLHAATLLPDGRVLVTGGIVDTWGVINSGESEVFDPVTGSWSYAGQMIGTRAGHAAILMANGEVLVAGGENRFPPRFTGRTETYEATAGWRSAGAFTTPRNDMRLTLMRDGRVLATGGVDRDNHALASAEIYDPASRSWRTTAPMSAARVQHASAALPDGRILVTGGSCAPDGEAFDPATERWTRVAGIGFREMIHATSTLLPDSSLLVVGGDYPDWVNECEPTSDWGALTTLRFTHADRYAELGSREKPLMRIQRLHHTATLLRSGELLVAGGGGHPEEISGAFDWQATTEIYSYATGAWRDGPSMLLPRASHTATRLLDGTVLVAGGALCCDGNAPAPTASAERFGPRPRSGMASARGIH